MCSGQRNRRRRHAPQSADVNNYKSENSRSVHRERKSCPVRFARTMERKINLSDDKRRDYNVDRREMRRRRHSGGTGQERIRRVDWAVVYRRMPKPH